MAVALLPLTGMGSAAANDTTAHVVEDIGAGRNADVVGTAEFSLDGSTLTIDTTLNSGVTLSEPSRACVDDEAFTERIAPGQCPNVSNAGGDYSITLDSALAASAQVCVQVHYTVDTDGGTESGGKTAYAGHQPSDRDFYGNVCLQRVTTAPSGLFTTECTATGAQADVGTLSEGSSSGGSFRLVAGAFSATVVSGQQDVAVPASSTIQLVYDPAAGEDTVLDTETSPAPCPTLPVTQPSGSFTPECIPSGAQADVGTLSEGTFTGGSFRLVAGTFSAIVVSGQQNVSVPETSTIQLVYDAAQGDDKVLDTKTSPGACTASTSETPAGENADTAVGGVKAGNDEADEAEEDDVAVQGTKAGAQSGVLAATGTGVPLVGTAALGLLLLIGGAVLIAAPARRAVARGQHRRG